MTKTIELDIGGMTCAACVARVERGLNKVDGVQDASVNLATERARVTYDPAQTAPPALLSRVREVGYEPREATAELDVAGMTCAACVTRVERALGRVDGVLDAAVNLATERATVRYLPGVSGVGELRAAVRGAGYEVRAGGQGEDRAAQARAEREREEAALWRDVRMSALFAIPLFLLAMAPMLSMPLHMWLMANVGERALNVVMLALAAPVQFGPGWRFIRRGLAALRHRAPDMNTLVLLGTGAAFGYSLLVTLAPGLFPVGSAHVYYEASAVVITLVLLGKAFEARARGRSGEAMRALLSLQPRRARVRRGGQELEVDAADLGAGDLLLVRPGEQIPADAEVLEGESYVDESLLTGESVPVAKGPGAAVVGGTLNGHGALTLRATRVGADTALAQIVAMVERAQGSKPPIQGLADRVVAVFVPVVLVIAALTFGAWLLWGGEGALSQALIHTVAVLIIACPCAMGLATPTSVMVGSGKAAQLGVLFRSGAALEGLGRANVIAFDKTGTLTRGRPALVHLEPAPGLDRAATLARIAAAERASEHPIARAVLAAAQGEGLDVVDAENVQAHPGHGVEATVGGERVRVGTARFLADVDLAAFAPSAQNLAERGHSPIYAALGTRPLALLAVADPIREEAQGALRALRAQGLRTVMVTGDQAPTARAVAAQLGIEDVHAEVLPGGKSDVIAALSGKGARVAFVGDGINDAPALAAADVGVAIGSGTDVALETADVILRGADLRGLPNAVALSRATLRNIRMNLVWAFGYNILLIPVAAGVLVPAFGISLSPVLAAAAMGLSSVFVLTNALGLRRFRAGAGRASKGLKVKRSNRLPLRPLDP